MAFCDAVLKTSKFIPIKSCGHEDSVATENGVMYQSKNNPMICTESCLDPSPCMACKVIHGVVYLLHIYILHCLVLVLVTTSGSFEVLD